MMENGESSLPSSFQDHLLFCSMFIISLIFVMLALPVYTILVTVLACIIFFGQISMGFAVFLIELVNAHRWNRPLLAYRSLST